MAKKQKDVPVQEEPVNEEVTETTAQTEAEPQAETQPAADSQAELLAAAEKMADTIAKHAPIAVRACKKAINEGLDVDMDAALVIEEKLFGSCFETADQKEGMGAFLEKRKHEPYQNK